MVSVIILNHNGGLITKECLDSVLRTRHLNYEVIIVDNGSTKDTYEWVDSVRQDDEQVEIVTTLKNLLYAGGMNYGIKRAKGELIVCLTNDTVVHPDWLLEIEETFKDKTIGAGNPMILKYGSNKIDTAIEKVNLFGLTYSIGYGEENHGQHNNKIIDYANGACMVLRKDVLRQVGLFDESYGLFWEDVDLSMRIRGKGWKIVLIPKAFVWHRGGSTVKTKNFWWIKYYTTKNRIKGMLKYGFPFVYFRKR